MKRIPSLNGLRAISIVAVIVGHLAATGSLPLSPHIIAVLERFPHLGVRVFFVLSGYLITTLILEERRKSGRFSLSKFYARRAWRIIPAAYILLSCLAIANLLHLVDIPWTDYIRSLAYTSPLTLPSIFVATLANTFFLHASGAVGGCCADIMSNLCIVLLVSKFSFSPVGLGARFLNFKPIVFVGTISYSLYLWQQIFLVPGGQAWIFRFPINLILVSCCALISYYLIERPSLRIRQVLRSENANQSQGNNSAPAQNSVGLDN